MNRIAVLMLAFPLCASTAAAQSTTSPATDPVIITAGSLAIRQSELEQAIATLPEEYQAFTRGEGRRQFAEDYVRMRLLADAGLKAGLASSRQVIAQLDLMRNNVIANAQLKAMEAGITIPEAELRQKYEAGKRQFEKATAKHILIAFKGSPAQRAGKPPLTEEEAKAKAEALRAQIAAGASLEDLARKESDDTRSGANGGALNEFGRGQMVPEFERAVFETPVGQLAPLTRTQFGYHVIRVVNRTVTPFEQVQNQLAAEERKARLQAALAKLVAETKPAYSDSYFGVKK